MGAIFVIYALIALAALMMLISFVCYRIVFYAAPAKPLAPGEFDIPQGPAYEPYRQQMMLWQQEMDRLPSQVFTVTSFDGLTLWGNYYEYAPGAVTEIMFHGYRGTPRRDLSGGINRAFSLGRNVLLVDQRAACRSGGRTITFGIREHRDCLTWANFAVEQFPDTKFILTGISMGAATVLMAAGRELPANVVGILADCGYTSPREIICKCARQMHLPPRLVYPFVRLGAWIFGGFDPDAYSPLEAMKTCRLPVIFFHGERDNLVPCSMSRKLSKACIAPSRLVTMADADHGLCYMAEPERYLQEVADFFSENGIATSVLS